MGRSRFILAGTGLCCAVALSVWLIGSETRAQIPLPQHAPAVPVQVAKAQRGDVPEYVQGIGAIQAYNAVTIHSRVDGTLMQVPVKEGQEVKQGDVVAVIDPRTYQATLNQTMAKKAQDEAGLANAKLDLERFASLAKQDFASRQQLDTQQALVAQDAAQIQGDEASIEQAQLNVSFAYITSPIPGRVGLRLMDPGNLVHSTDTQGIITIMQDHPIAAVFTVPQGQLPDIAKALKNGSVNVIALSSDGTHQLDTGTLVAPNNEVDQSTGTIQLKAEFPNKNNGLWPGQFIEAHVQVATAHEAVSIPQAAVQNGPDGQYVFVVKPDNTVALQPIAIGYQTPAIAVVTKGLNGDETLVTEGALRLEPGSRVTIGGQQVARS